MCVQTSRVLPVNVCRYWSSMSCNLPILLPLKALPHLLVVCIHMHTSTHIYSELAKIHLKLNGRGQVHIHTFCKAANSSLLIAKNWFYYRHIQCWWCQHAKQVLNTNTNMPRGGVTSNGFSILIQMSAEYAMSRACLVAKTILNTLSHHLCGLTAAQITHQSWHATHSNSTI